MNRQFIRPMKQNVWGWPAVINFSLGGAAAGFYLLSFLMVSLQDDIHNVFKRAPFQILAPLLVGIGFFVLTFEASRPLRSYNLFRNLRRSWMSRESLAAAMFIPSSIINWLFPHPFIWILAAAMAAGFMISQGYIIYRARAVIAWNAPVIPLFFVTSGFASGGGLVMMVQPGRLDLLPCLILLLSVILNLIVWFVYLWWSHEKVFKETNGSLRSKSYLILIVGVGHILPLVLLVMHIALPFAELSPFITALAGFAIIVGVVSQKVGIILKVGYMRGIELKWPKGNVSCV